MSNSVVAKFVHEARATAAPGTFLASLPVQARAPRLPQTNDVALTNILPPFGTNPPQGPIANQDLDLNDRYIRSDPRELWYLSLPNKLTPQQCLQILRSTLGGDVWQQWQLCAIMLDSWPTFRMASHQLMEAAAYARYAVHPCAEEGKKPTPQAIERADLVSRAIRSMHPDPFNDEKGFSGMCYTLCDAMLNGVSTVELIWDFRTSSDHGRERLPVSSAWVHPRHVSFTNDGRIAVFSEGYNRLTYSGAPQSSFPSPDKFLCAQFMSKAGSALGAGFMRPLVWYWAARQFNLEWMLNTAKQYGSPFIDITYKPGSVSTGPGGELEKLNELLKTAGSQRRLIHPEGTLANIHPPTSLGKENPQRVLEEKADEACLFLLLGQKGTTTPTQGALGSQDTHETVKDERIAGVANWLARNPLRQFARAVLRVNYGNDDECPNIEPDFTKPLKPEQVGQMMSAVSGSRVPVRADEFYKKVGFTQPEAGEVVLAGGIIGVQSEPMTDDERFDQQLGQQVKQAEVQMELQGEADQGAPAQASERGKAEFVWASNPEGHNQWTTAVNLIKEKHGVVFNNHSGGRTADSYHELASVDEAHKAHAGIKSILERLGYKSSPEKAEKNSTALVTTFKHKDRSSARISRSKSGMAATKVLVSLSAPPEISSSGGVNDVARFFEHQDKVDRSFKAARGTKLRDVLHAASSSELDELEAKLTAAENAPHHNGEVEDLKETVISLANKRFEP